MAAGNIRLVYSEDVVEHPEHSNMVGVVLQNAQSSEDEVSSSDEEEQIPKGHCVVAWYPKGVEEEMEETKLKLVDRSLLPGDVVRWGDTDKPTQKGFVKGVHVKVDLRVTGANYMISRIDAKQLNPIQEIFTGLPVAYGPWIGIVREVFYALILRLKNGCRYYVKGDPTNLLVDMTDQRDEDSPFYCFGFYPGQHVYGPARVFREAEWISGTRPIFGNNQRVRAVVEEATLAEVNVDWQVCGYVGDLVEGAPAAPGYTVGKEEIAKLIPLNLFREASIQVGDKAFYTLSDDDVAAYWQCVNRGRAHAPIAGSEAEPRENAPTSPVMRQESSTENACRPGLSSTEDAVADSANANRGATISSSEGSGDEDEREEPQEGRGAPASHGGFRRADSRHASGFSQTRSLSGRRRRHLPRRKRKKLVTLRVAQGERVCCEVCRTQTEIDVVWQDGVVDVSIPSTELVPVLHLDELEFFPGDFVVDKRAGAPADRLGVVKCANNRDRICEVTWIPVPNVTDAAISSSSGLTETLSVYDIADHKDYNFRPGDCVMQLEGAEGKRGQSFPSEVESGEQSQEEQKPEKNLENPGVIGQVERVSPEGGVRVWWSNGSITTEACYHVFVVHREDDDEDDGLSSEDGTTDDDSEGWETASDSSEDAPMDAQLDPLEDIIMRSLAALGNRNQDRQSEAANHFPDSQADDPMTGSDLVEGPGKESRNQSEGDAVHTASARETCSAETEKHGSASGGVHFRVLESSGPFHHFFHNGISPVTARQFASVVRRELLLLQSSLPSGIHIAAYEDRLDLFSVLIEGPPGTPYEGGLLSFDIQLSPDYPRSPPTVFYSAYCTGRLNPNLYEDGKVCVSLLGTWTGKGTETWTSKSNLCQLMLSLQGLILCAEPYYNEAGYEKHKGTAEGVSNSRLYNEMVIIKLLQSAQAMIRNPPVPFAEQVLEYFARTLKSCVTKFRTWIAEFGPNGPKAGQADPSVEFPLFPLSHGFCLTLQRTLDSLEATMNLLP